MVRPFQKPSRRIFILVVSLGGIINNRFTSFSYPFIFNLLDELRVSSEGKNIIIANNLCTSAGGTQYYGIDSKFVQLAAGDNVQIYHNTCLLQGDIVAG